MKVTMIAAVDTKLGLAKNNRIPWTNQSDKAWLRARLANQVVICTYNTYRELVISYTNTMYIIVTPSETKLPVMQTYTVEEALQLAGLLKAEEVLIAGGPWMYKHMYPYATHLELTHIPSDYKCDMFFPDFLAKDVWQRYPNSIKLGRSGQLCVYKKN